MTSSIIVTHFAGRAGDHSDSAMRASPRLAAALAERVGVADIVVVGDPQPALNTDWRSELTAAHADLTEMRSAHVAALVAGAAPVTALSRCAVALSTLPAVGAHRPDAAVVWFDAHADLNTPASSPTAFLGGMALSGPVGLWDSGLGRGLDARNVILAGTRDVDPAEADTIRELDIAVIEPGPRFAQRLSEAVAGRPTYVHIDCDVLDPGTVPTDYTVRRGLTLQDLHDACTLLARNEIVGIEIGELETRDGTEDLAPLLDAVSPVLLRIRRQTA